MSEHTPGPWAIDDIDDGIVLEGHHYGPMDEMFICMLEGISKVDARRIVVCVNACEGINTETLEQYAKQPHSVHIVTDKEYHELKAENARLREALVRVVAWGNERNFDTTCESGKMLINARAALGKKD
jgi:hypothetical protein